MHAIETFDPRLLDDRAKMVRGIRPEEWARAGELAATGKYSFGVPRPEPFDPTAIITPGTFYAFLFINGDVYMREGYYPSYPTYLEHQSQEQVEQNFFKLPDPWYYGFIVARDQIVYDPYDPEETDDA